MRDKVDLVYATPLEGAFTKPVASRYLGDMLAQRGITVVGDFGASEVDGVHRRLKAYDGRELDYDLLISIPQHGGAEVITRSGLGDSSGWIPTHRHTLAVTGIERAFALGDATDLPLSKAGSTAHFEAPVVAERIAAAVENRAPAGKHADYEGKVMCFFEIGDGKGTLLQFDYDHPPKPPKPNQLWHLGKIVFNKTYWHTVPKGRV
jgi:sulfide:quinone oxidoreductase